MILRYKNDSPKKSVRISPTSSLFVSELKCCAIPLGVSKKCISFIDIDSDLIVCNCILLCIRINMSLLIYRSIVDTQSIRLRVNRMNAIQQLVETSPAEIGGV